MISYCLKKNLYNNDTEYDITIKKLNYTIEQHENTIKKLNYTIEQHENTIKKHNYTIEQQECKTKDLHYKLNNINIENDGSLCSIIPWCKHDKCGFSSILKSIEQNKEYTEKLGKRLNKERAEKYLIVSKLNKNINLNSVNMNIMKNNNELLCKNNNLYKESIIHFINSKYYYKSNRFLPILPIIHEFHIFIDESNMFMNSISS
jgi:septal ring factor EnvC (AmiA/AmiB activator)